MSPAALAEIDVTGARAAYDLSAPFYDAWLWQDFWRRHEYPLVAAELGRVMPGRHDAAALDVGCGTGWYLARVSPHFAQPVGIDLSHNMLARATLAAPGAALIQADAQALPFAPASFSLVLSTRVLSHLPDMGHAIAEMCRVTRPGGTILLTNVDAEFDYDKTRLPVADAHIATETYKYPRALVADALRGAGARHGRSMVIGPDGIAWDLPDLAAPTCGAPAGWVSVWDMPTDVLAGNVL